MFKKLSLWLVLAVSLSAQYTPTSPYLNNPDLFIPYVDSCARFWFNSYDQAYGGFYTNVDRQGNVITSWGTNKRPLTQTRHAYAFSKAFMLTGDEVYLQKASDALGFLYSKAWDNQNGGWYTDLNRNGSPVNGTSSKSAFDAHYALLGIASYYEATRDTTALRHFNLGYDLLENKYWDKGVNFGYFDQAAYNFSSRSGKSFNATVDALTTHLLLMSGITGEQKYKTKTDSVVLNILQKIAPSMDAQQIGFAELYNSDWSINQSNTLTIMGHVLKTAWVLGRAYHLNQQQAYLAAANKLFTNVWNKGYDHVYGAPYKDYNRVTGVMQLWGIQDSAKAWWQVEQAITGGLELWSITGDTRYLEAADESISFFMNYFVDHVYGEVYENTTRRGGRVWGEHKGNGFKAAYHSVETGYLGYLYSKLYIKNEPFSLYYKISPKAEEYTFSVNPLLTPAGKIKITSVTLDGAPYQNFNPVTLEITVAAGTGGKFRVIYQPQNLTDISVDEPVRPAGFTLNQNYPNPFNPATVISFELGRESDISMAVYDVMGGLVKELASGVYPAGQHRISFDASGLNAGVYFYTLRAAGETLTRKMTLVK